MNDRQIESKKERKKEKKKCEQKKMGSDSSLKSLE